MDRVRSRAAISWGGDVECVESTPRGTGVALADVVAAANRRRRWAPNGVSPADGVSSANKGTDGMGRPAPTTQADLKTRDEIDSPG